MKRPVERTYRDFSDTDRWTAFRVKAETTDLYIRAPRDRTEEAHAFVSRLREELYAHIALQRDFLTALAPIPRVDSGSSIVNAMYDASESAGVGPMAAVAGAFAEAVGRHIALRTDEVIVENGGDIWLQLASPAVVDIFAGGSPFTGRLAIRVDPAKTPVGICTSSGTVGPSLSFGRADAATVMAINAALADAVATGMGNLVKCADDADRALDYALGIRGVGGALVVFRDTLAVRGDVELVRPDRETDR